MATPSPPPDGTDSGASRGVAVAITAEGLAKSFGETPARFSKLAAISA